MKSLIVFGIAAVLSVGAFAKTYYVDPTGGCVSSDGYDGEAEVWDGTHGPRRTLEGVMALAKKIGDVVIALPGVYNEGAMNQSTYGSNRVVVASGVLLKSRDGAVVTTIEGCVSTLADADDNGCGTDSMRCVYLNANAVLCGFTLTKGRTSTLVSGNNIRVGGGVNGGYCVDCVFSDNASVSGGAHAFSSKLLRCYLGSVPSGGGYPCFLGVHLVDCVYDTATGYAYNNIRAYNTTFVQGYLAASKSDYAANVYNCVFLDNTASSRTHFYNCRSVAAIASSCTDEGGNEFGVDASELQYEEGTYRPTVGSRAIDKGNAEYYALATNGWTALAQSFVGVDFTGGQRVYNGAIDIGAGEYDWRGDFGKKLAQKGVAVLYASSGVMTNEVAGVDLANGEKMAIVPTLKTAGKVSFVVSIEGGGAVTVMHGGTELVPVSGIYSFEGVVGENDDVTVAFTGDGVATVSGFDLPKRGIQLIFY